MAKATPRATHPGHRLLKGRRVSTLRTACFSKVRVCPSLSVSVTEPVAAESKRPLTFRLPWGASSLYRCTSVFVLGGTACTLDQSGVCLAAQDGRRDKDNRSARALAVVFVKSPLVGASRSFLLGGGGPFRLRGGRRRIRRALVQHNQHGPAVGPRSELVEPIGHCYQCAEK